MKTMDKFANWFMDHDNRVMVAHNKKERKTIHKELEHLQKERLKMQGHLHSIEALIDMEDELEASITGTDKGEF